MKKAFLLFCMAMLGLAAYAAEPEEGGANAVNPPQSAPSKGTLPKLVIRWDCGQCEPNEKVPPLIEQSYVQKASAEGFKISDTESAEVSINDFRQRPPGVRVMFGFMAGKDRLAVRINYRGKALQASDSSANAMYGMNSLCETVGNSSATQLIQLIKSGAPAEVSAQM